MSNKTALKNSHNNFEKYLIEQDSRYTNRKREIADVIFKSKTHFEVDEFLAKLHSQKRRFSRATFYRTIKQLLDAGLIQKVNMPDGKVFYEQTASREHHAHLICNFCGKISEFEETQLLNKINSYCTQQQFTPRYHSIHIYADCEKENCAGKAQAQEK